ncbi:MAG TPA: uracil-DNA glycosylase, partial [Labilithrix sp.]|nr:uracil-DNA glycosylase [Labilithrix sp.]
MDEKPSPSLAFVPAGSDDYDELVSAAQRCQACDLYKGATRAVFGEGPVPAPMMLVGEQPGEDADYPLHSISGSARELLDDALEAAEIPVDQVYITNAVKHRKWESKGKRRLTVKPTALEVHACRGWLDAEIRLVHPEIIVCLGATAAHVFFGRRFRWATARGELHDGAPWAKRLLATYHPAELLRMADA